MSVQIEKKVPMPKVKNKYPWDEMEVGDSFLNERPISYLGNRWAKTNGNQKRFSAKQEGKVYRIWRVK